MKKILFLILSVLISTNAWATAAQDVAALMGLGFSPEQASYLTGMTNALTAVTSAIIPVTDNARDLGDSTHGFRDLYISRNAAIKGTLAVTGVSTFTGLTNHAGNALFAAGFGPQQVPQYITPLATPLTSGASLIVNKVAVFPTPMVTAVNGAMLPAVATANVGEAYEVWNQSVAGGSLFPSTGGSINNATANYHIPVPAKNLAKCYVTAADTWWCTTFVAPTPAS